MSDSPGGLQHTVPAAVGGLRLLVISDVRLFRDGVARMLHEHPCIGAVDTAANADEAVAVALRTHPHVAVVDMAASRHGDTVRALRARVSCVRIVAVGISAVEQDILTCAELGVTGVVARDATLAELTTAIAAAARGELHCSPHMASIVFRRLADLSSRRLSAGALDALQLTPRELEIVTLIQRGLSNRAIAERLHIEYATVKNHVHHILEKLHVRSRSEIAALCRSDFETTPSLPATDAATAAPPMIVRVGPRV